MEDEELLDLDDTDDELLLDLEEEELPELMLDSDEELPELPELLETDDRLELELGLELAELLEL